MDGVARIAVICLLTMGWCAAVAETPLAVFPINEQAIAQMRKQHPLASAEVNDPVYKRKQRYQGLWLADVLKDLSRGDHPEAGLYVRFRCKDGYLPMMPLARAMGAKGLIAIRDANASQGEDWQPLPGGGTLAPSYLCLAFASRRPRRISMALSDGGHRIGLFLRRLGWPQSAWLEARSGTVRRALPEMPCHQWRWRDIRAGAEFSLQRNGILESAPLEPIHCERRQYSSWNQDARLQFAAGAGHPANRRISSGHGRPQEAWRRMSISRNFSCYHAGSSTKCGKQR
jgi:hypothetical protein